MNKCMEKATSIYTPHTHTRERGRRQKTTRELARVKCIEDEHEFESFSHIKPITIFPFYMDCVSVCVNVRA